jgi:hypothetical protein
MLSVVGWTLAFDGCSPFLRIRWLIDLRFSRRRSLSDLGALLLSHQRPPVVFLHVYLTRLIQVLRPLLRLARWRTPGTFQADSRWQWPSLWRLSFEGFENITMSQEDTRSLPQMSLPFFF